VIQRRVQRIGRVRGTVEHRFPHADHLQPGLGETLTYVNYTGISDEYQFD